MSLLITACSTEEVYTYKAPKDNVYLDMGNDADRGRDGLQMNYSFADEPGLTEHTVMVPVLLSGVKRENDTRTFKAAVAENQDVAEGEIKALPNVHYVPLTGEYTLTLDEDNKAYLPVTLLNNDPATMDIGTVMLTVMLLPSDDFGTELPGTRAELRFSNLLMQPDWWPPFASELPIYSRNALELFRISTGLKDLDMPEGGAVSAQLMICAIFRAFLVDPFEWVEGQDDYAISEGAVENGNQTYGFYSTVIPGKTYKFQRDSNNQRIAFFDENGEPTIVGYQ